MKTRGWGGGRAGPPGPPPICSPLLTPHLRSAGSGQSSPLPSSPGGGTKHRAERDGSAPPFPARGDPKGSSPSPHFSSPPPTSHRGLGARDSAPRAPTACSTSASRAQSRTMSLLAEKSFRVEKRYLGSRAESSVPTSGCTQHPWVPPLPAPHLLSQEKSPLAAPISSTTQASREKGGGWGVTPPDGPSSTRVWVRSARSRSPSVSVRRLVLASSVSCNGERGRGRGGEWGGQDADQGAPRPRVPLSVQP